MKTLSIAICASLNIVVFSVCLAQSGKQPLSFEQIFPKSQQQKMGLHKLSEREKEALRVHVEKLLLEAIASCKSLGSVKAGSDEGRVYAGAGGGHWIKKTLDRGTHIILEDGSFWQIDPLDKIQAMLWLPLSDITVAESASGLRGYDYLLINTDDGKKVHAKYIGRQ